MAVITDSANQVFETVETNNVTVAARKIRLQGVDLAVSSVTVASAAFFGQTLDVTWVVRNLGDLTMNGWWTDRIWLATDAGLGNAQVLLDVPVTEAVSLAPGATRTRSAAVTLPLVQGLLPANSNR